MNPTILSADQVQQQATAEQLNVITNVSNTQRYLVLNNAKELYKQNIREGNLKDGFIYLFGALPYASYGFFNGDGTLSTTVDLFANIFKELYDFYLENNRENNQEEIHAGVTSLVTFILKVSDFTNDRLDTSLEYDDFQGYFPEKMVQLLMDIIIKTGTSYDFNITPVDINVIMYYSDYFKSESFTSLKRILMNDLDHQEVLNDFYSRTGQPYSMSYCDY